MFPRPPTCGNVACVCQHCLHLHTTCRLRPARQGRSVALSAHPFPATLPARSQGKQPARARQEGNLTVMSTAKPGTRPVTSAGLSHAL